MSAQPIEWHKECLKNQTLYLEEQRRRLARFASEVEQTERRVAFYTEQIAEAEKKGRASFDSKRLLVKRKRGGCYA